MIKEPYLHRDPSGRPRHLSSSLSRVSESCESLTSGTPDKLFTEGGASSGLWPRLVSSASPSGLSLCDSSLTSSKSFFAVSSNFSTRISVDSSLELSSASSKVLSMSMTSLLSSFSTTSFLVSDPSTSAVKSTRGLVSVFAYSSFTKVSIIFVLKYVFYVNFNFRFV